MEANVGHHRSCNHVEEVVVYHNGNWNECIVPVAILLVYEVIAANLVFLSRFAAVSKTINPVLSVVNLEPILLVLIITEAAESSIDVVLYHVLLLWRLIEILPSFERLPLIPILAVGGVKSSAIKLFVIIKELERLLHSKLEVVSHEDYQGHEREWEEKTQSTPEHRYS